MHGEYQPKPFLAKSCEICSGELKPTQKRVCGPQCAGKLYGNKARGTGTVKPYIQIRVNGKRVYLHRHVWETANGRKLRDGEIVHHKDENKRNNDPSNIEAVKDRAEHLRQHNYFRGPKRDHSPIDAEFGW